MTPRGDWVNWTRAEMQIVNLELERHPVLRYLLEKEAQGLIYYTAWCATLRRTKNDFSIVFNCSKEVLEDILRAGLQELGYPFTVKWLSKETVDVQFRRYKETS